MDSADLNRALRIYLGSVPSGGVVPYGGPERVRSTHGDRSPEILQEITRLIDGLCTDEELVNLPSLVAIGTFIEERARSTRPDLADDVRKALGNYVSYSYR